jgi:non-lysosomal glucosylceramidase
VTACPPKALRAGYAIPPNRHVPRPLSPQLVVYENVFAAQLTCEQFSPIWAHNYQEASYPVAVFAWTAHNPTEAADYPQHLVSWQNLVGWFTNTEKSPEVQQRDDGSPYYDYVPALGAVAGM